MARGNEREGEGPSDSDNEREGPRNLRQKSARGGRVRLLISHVRGLPSLLASKPRSIFSGHRALLFLQGRLPIFGSFT